MLALIRWTLDPDEASLSAQTELLRRQVIPARREILRISYASRQRPKVWFTVIAPEADCRRLAQDVVFPCCEPGILRGDPLLDPGMEGFCLRLHATNSVVPDLLT